MNVETPTSGMLTAEAVAALNDPDIPATFVQNLFGRVPRRIWPPIRPGRSPASPRRPTSTSRRPGPAAPTCASDLRLVDLEIEREGRREDVTVLEVVNDNMPFLLDSTLAEIVDQGYEPLLVAHPILAVERDAAGALVRLVGEAAGRARRRARGARASSTSISTASTTRAPASACVDGLAPGLRGRRPCPCGTGRPCAGASPRSIADLSRQPAAAAGRRGRRGGRLPRLDGAATTSRSSALREYRFPAGDTAADPVEGSGLGILRDPAVRVLRRGRELVAMTPEIRAFLARPQALIITKANVKSRVHRRVHLDYVGVKLFDGRRPARGRTAHRRPVHRRAPIPAPPARCPICASRWRASSRRAGFDPASHSGRALLNVLENYPRDELFQIDEDTLYRFAIDIMNLSERPAHPRAGPGRTSSTASSRCSSSCPKDRYDTRCAPPHRRVPGRDLSRAASRPPIRPIRKARSPAPTTSSAATRARPRRSPRERSKRASPPSSGPGATRCATRSTTRSAARAPAPSRPATPTPSAPPIARPSAPAEAIVDIDILEQLSDASARAPSTSTAARATPTTRANLKVFSRGAALPLSERVPLLENLGFRVVNERTYRVAAARRGEASASGCTT